MPNLIDTYSRHAHYLEQYYNGESAKINKFLNRIARELRLELTKTDTVTSQARIKKLLAFSEELARANFDEFTEDFKGQLELFAESEVEFSNQTLSNDDFETIIPPTNQVTSAVMARPFNNKLLKDSLKDFSRVQSKLVRDTIASGFYEGKPTQEIVRSVVGTKALNYKNGILNVSRTSGERMVRTALNHTSNVAKDRFYKANEDLIPYYELVATLDSRTSDICKGLDGKIFKVGKGPLAPFHPNCRTTSAPVLAEEVNKDGTKKTSGGFRASEQGLVDADLNYNDWLKKQSKQFQIDALGKTKADLFRKGGLSVDKFTNNGVVLTLDQLKTKYPIAWGKI